MPVHLATTVSILFYHQYVSLKKCYVETSYLVSFIENPSISAKKKTLAEKINVIESRTVKSLLNNKPKIQAKYVKTHFHNSTNISKIVQLAAYVISALILYTIESREKSGFIPYFYFSTKTKIRTTLIIYASIQNYVGMKPKFWKEVGNKKIYNFVLTSFSPNLKIYVKTLNNKGFGFFLLKYILFQKILRRINF